MIGNDSETQTRAEPPVAYRVLARKYRPRDFSDLIGQEPMVRTLTNAFSSNRIAQAYMLTGVRGVGKTTTARILARALNFRNDKIDHPTIDLAEIGEHCQAIMEGHHVDVIEMDAASHTGIEDIREIIEQVRYRPVAARYKVYIIDEVHMLSTQAFNGLLKTLEEPPEHVKFIFATTEIRKVPITVLSRCQRFDLRRIEAGALVAHFTRIAEQEEVGIETEALRMIARAAEGSVRDGLSLLDQAIAHGGGDVTAEAVRAMLGLADRALIVDLFAHLAQGDIAAALELFNGMYALGASPIVVLQDLAAFTHLATRIKFIPESETDPAITEIERDSARMHADTLSVVTLSRLWQMLLKGLGETEMANDPFAAAEMVLIRLAHSASLPSPDALVRELAERQASGESDRPVAAPKKPEKEKPGKDQPGTTKGSEAANGGVPHTASTPPVSAVTRLHGDDEVSLQRGPAEAKAVARQRTSKAVPEDTPRPEPDRSAAASPGQQHAIRSLDDLLILAERQRDPVMRIHLRKYVRAGKIEAGRIEIGLSDDAPAGLVGDLSRKLEMWTGQRWMISVDGTITTRTVEETEKSARDTLIEDARHDPDVAAILSAFPGARITDVRVMTGHAADMIDKQGRREASDDLPMAGNGDDA